MNVVGLTVPISSFGWERTYAGAPGPTADPAEFTITEVLAKMNGGSTVPVSSQDDAAVVISEGMRARCNIGPCPQHENTYPQKLMSPQGENTYPQKSTNMMKNTVVSAVDNVYGLVDYVLASDRNLSSDFTPLACFKEQILMRQIFALDGDDEVFAV